MSSAAIDLTSQAPSERIASLRALLKQKFPGTSQIDSPDLGVLPTGVADIDRLLPGGLPRGAVSLLSGPPSSGKTGAALRVLATLTGQGGQAAWVHQGAFSIASAAWAGVDPRNLLQVQVESSSEALRCADFLLRWQAFHLVVLDWVGRGGHGSRWSRLQNLVTDSPGALLVVAPSPAPGDPLRFVSAVHLSFERAPDRPAQQVIVDLDKTRYARPDGPPHALVEHQGMAGAPFVLDPELPGLGQRWHHEL